MWKRIRIIKKKTVANYNQHLEKGLELMKKKDVVKLIVLTGVAAILNVTTAFAGTWEEDGSSWKYLKDNGQYAEYEWIQEHDGGWYYFGRWGIMETNCLIDGYYVGADGKMLAEQDTNNPLYGETIYGTCYLQIKSYQDMGNYYKANISLYDSSFGTSENFGKYKVGDKFWIESVNDYGTVTKFNMDTGGNIFLEVKYKKSTYFFSVDDTFVSTSNSGESMVLRHVKDDVEVEIPKNITIVPSENYSQFAISLEDLLNGNVYKAIPVFNGKRVEKLYDTELNYAG